MTAQRQWMRKASLIVSGAQSAALADGSIAGGQPSGVPGGGLDLSRLHFQFHVEAADVETPNNASFRIFNLADKDIQAIREFTRITLDAGYQDSHGVIFDGTIKQFRRGRESAVDTYLDILAADSDSEYNWSTINTSLVAGSTPDQRVKVISDAMGLPVGYVALTGTERLSRGKVLFGMARDLMGIEARTQLASWSVQDGSIQIIPLDKYRPDVEEVVLNSTTGLVGAPELTDQGVMFRCLLNPRLRVGGVVRLNNNDITTLMQASSDPTVFNSRTRIQQLARLSGDGRYRVFVVSYDGDTRGVPWYCDVIGLAIDSSSQTVRAG
jgi:hypothetical protein